MKKETKTFYPLSIPTEQRSTAALLEGLAGTTPIETHISAVFVGAETVWKLKKAVHLPFHDFTDVAERRRTALRELELNAPHAPGMYRDVAAVTRAADGTLTLGGEGVAIDWVLRMARVPAPDFLDAVAARGELNVSMQDALADAVAAMHAALDPAEKDQAAGLLRIATGNHRSAEAAGLPRAAIDSWLAAMRAAIGARTDWLRARGAAGFVRRAHGDLHLGNLCLREGRPVPFDALEFDEDMATIDLGYDFAFLLMDLDIRVGRAAANRVMNRYLARTGDWDMVRGLPVFLSMRAMVRAHVVARGGERATASAYLDRALAYLEPGKRAVVVAIGGLPGVGKSTVARALAPDLGPAPGAVIVRSDEIRKRLQGVAPETRLPASAYGAAQSRAVFEAINAAVRCLAAAGHAVIADATFMDPVHRASVAAAAEGARFLGVWLDAELPVLEARVATRRDDASDADLTVLRRAAASGAGAPEWLAVPAGPADDPAETIRIRLDADT